MIIRDEYAESVAALFLYARNFACKNERAGRGTVWPTFRQAANRMHCTYDELQDLIDDYQGTGYLGAGVGIRAGGAGGGTYFHEVRGEYVVEAYGEDD